MNLKNPSRLVLSCIFRLWLKSRTLFPRRKCRAFAIKSENEPVGIQKVYVINLDRQPHRWSRMKQELKRILDSSGRELLGLTERHSAVDGKAFLEDPPTDSDIVPFYTLEDQLLIEPQPLALPTQFHLSRSIRMSRPEVAVARSHINVWRQVAASDQDHSLILEDDVWFHSGFAGRLDQAWDEITSAIPDGEAFDVLYVSYLEVKHGAPKTFISDNLFRPDHGLWHLSGYVLSREGAQKLLRRLPCRGPIDLWINHQFKALNVCATRQSLISQRRDTCSTNSYSVLPSLTSIGAITSEGASLFNIRPTEQPVFAFGDYGSGTSSLAMALSMLGYRCCSDLRDLPASELEKLLAGRSDRVFNAYVNIGSLAENVKQLRERYPSAKFILTTTKGNVSDALQAVKRDLDGFEIAVLDMDSRNRWQVVCEHLRCAPPICTFPVLPDLDQRAILHKSIDVEQDPTCEQPKRDESPWVVESPPGWHGVHLSPAVVGQTKNETAVTRIQDDLECLDARQWLLRSDTFTDNLALFRPANVEFRSGIGATLSVRKECLGVREYSAASLCSKNKYLFGRFEAVIQASNVPGVVTGFFLHRNSPRQEIDIEITGNRPSRLIVNVFYNPGGLGANFNYGYRGAPSYIDLGFDASESPHHFAIEWSSTEIRWLVDDKLVHRRAVWDPTPIPHLPLTLHVNSWLTRSTELAGRVNNKQLPSITVVESIGLVADPVEPSGDSDCITQFE
ncbi:MAG TPA: family 16 glycosylhydrolase [Planctomicrobium sp.]|nr:family 16 glycosylhydrolase [Planctomicrobium sp.]